jgi:hypothetical protein
LGGGGGTDNSSGVDVMEEEVKKWIKDNFIKLAKEHKAHCKDSDIDLTSLLIALYSLGISLTKEEKEVFL